MFRIAIALTALLPVSALAQSASAEQSGADIRLDDDRWTVGVAASVKDSPYAGEGMRVQPFPLVTYEGERVYWRGVTFGVHLVEAGGFTLDAVVSGRFDGFDRGDLGRLELERNGVDIDRLADRDDGADAGLAARWRLGDGEFRLSAVADITGTSEGYELSADYGHRFRIGKTMVIPGIGVQWLSDDLANYYYGVQPGETFAATPYQPDAALVPRVSVAFARPLVGKWRLQGLLQYQYLPDELADSPLLERNSGGVGHLVLGVVRSF
ncbi:MAG: MipA/OmpV family protein [Luteimonas sp.]